MIPTALTSRPNNLYCKLLIQYTSKGAVKIKDTPSDQCFLACRRNVEPYKSAANDILPHKHQKKKEEK
jgi:hypothetical protein